MIDTTKIRTLTKQDAKTIVERALKLCEETGELAAAVLVDTCAPGCEYKRLEADALLNEIADVLIVALSIADSYHFSDEVLANAIAIKCDKWNRVIHWSQNNQ